MSAIAVSFATSILTKIPPSCSISNSGSLFFSKIRSVSSSHHNLRLSFGLGIVSLNNHRRMAHTIAKATLGLTQPNQIEQPQITFAAKEIDVAEWKGDILAVGVTEKDLAKDANSKFENPILKKIDAQLSGLLAEASSEEDFSGKTGQSTVLRFPGIGSKRVSLIGLGQSASSASAFRGFGEAVAAAAKSAQASTDAIVLASYESLSSESKLHSASAIASGCMIYVFKLSAS